ncbi:MAG: trigger factor [Balneolales bacterium]|nr:trigger factor [Balneolales bacterium]
MNISVENITSVDKKIVIEADQSDLGPRIDKALRKYRRQMNIPGFRSGTAPMGLIKKRIGKEVENEQIDEFVQETFQKEIIPNHSPVGEPEMSKLEYNDGKLLVEFLIGVKPEFELTDISSVEVDKLVHDVTDEEVEKEYEFTLRRSAEWSETEEPATEDSRVTADVVKLDANGEETEDRDDDMELDLKSQSSTDYKPLIGKKKGESVTIEMGEGDDKETFKVTLKAVKTHTMPETNEEFFKQNSRDEATNEEEFKSFLKSRIQDYFDSTSDDLLKDKLVMNLVESHDFEVPKNIAKQILSDRIERLKQENNGEIPAGFNEEDYVQENATTLKNEGKWTFIVSRLIDQYPETEINAEDIDNFFQLEAAKMGLPAEMLKNFYASQSEQLENLRMRIRTDKLFAKLMDEVKINELSKEDYETKYSNKEA